MNDRQNRKRWAQRQQEQARKIMQAEFAARNAREEQARKHNEAYAALLAWYADPANAERVAEINATYVAAMQRDPKLD